MWLDGFQQQSSKVCWWKNQWDPSGINLWKVWMWRIRVETGSGPQVGGLTRKAQGDVLLLATYPEVGFGFWLNRYWIVEWRIPLFILFLSTVERRAFGYFWNSSFLWFSVLDLLQRQSFYNHAGPAINHQAAPCDCHKYSLSCCGLCARPVLSVLLN